MVYSSKQNPLIKEIASLKEKKYRLKLGLYMAEGIKMVNEAIVNDLPIKYIVATNEALVEIKPNNAEVIVVTSEVFSYLSEEMTPQGAMAVIKISNIDLKSPTGNALILDGVSNPGNMGTIIRTANAFGFKDIYLINCVDVYNGKTIRASMSGIFFVNLYKTEYQQLKTLLKGYKIVVADMAGESLDDFSIDGNLAIVVGNEGNGVSKEMLEMADSVVSIPMQENSESLNVAVACSIMMYKLRKT